MPAPTPSKQKRHRHSLPLNGVWSLKMDSRAHLQESAPAQVHCPLLPENIRHMVFLGLTPPKTGSAPRATAPPGAMSSHILSGCGMAPPNTLLPPKPRASKEKGFQPALLRSPFYIDSLKSQDPKKTPGGSELEKGLTVTTHTVSFDLVLLFQL